MLVLNYTKQRPNKSGEKLQRQDVKRERVFRFVVAIIFLLTANAYGQQDSSTIRGVVTDPSAAAVPGVRVIVTDLKTNRTFTTKTDSKGEYYAPSLTVSVYSIRFSMRGFRTTDLNDITLHANETLAENARL
jgi:Carboxypeptidase regulatory-like domain